VKVRQRQRRPTHPASSSTVAPEEESEPITQKPSLRKLSRYNNQEPKEKEATVVLKL